MTIAHKPSVQPDGTSHTRETVAVSVSMSPTRLIKFYQRIRALSLGLYTDSFALNIFLAQKSIPVLKIRI